jgi:SAM-dependent methyltransferase
MFGDAIAYDRYMGRWSRRMAPLLLDFAGIPDAGSVLDVGSGTGSLAVSIAGHKPHCHVLGIDLSEEYVEYATSQTPPGARVSFEVGDAQRLRFADASFDHTLSLLVLNFVPDQARAVAEMVRVTRPGGSVAAAVWDYGEGMRMLRLFWDSALSVDPRAEIFDERRMPLCRQDELSALWKNNGLAGVEEYPLEITMQFSELTDYWDPFVLGQGPAGAYARRIGGADLNTLRNEVKRRLGVATDNQPFDLPARAWAVRGIVPLG